MEKNWPPKADLKLGEPYILHRLLVDTNKIISSLHMKLGLMKQFVKSLPIESDYFK